MTRAFTTVLHLSSSTTSHGDAFLTAGEERAFLEREVCVFEKLDGVNAVLHHGRAGLEVHLKAKWRRALGGRLLRGVELWALLRERDLLRAIPRGGELVVEWLRYQLSLRYEGLPDLAIGIAANDPRGRPIPHHKARKLFERAGLVVNEPLFRGKLGDVASVRALATRSRYARGLMEGLVVEKVRPDALTWCKWVRRGYRQPTPDELSALRRNGLATSS